MNESGQSVFKTIKKLCIKIELVNQFIFLHWDSLLINEMTVWHQVIILKDPSLYLQGRGKCATKVQIWRAPTRNCINRHQPKWNPYLFELQHMSCNTRESLGMILFRRSNCLWKRRYKKQKKVWRIIFLCQSELWKHENLRFEKLL